jgi:serine/threonine-protein kinase
MGQVRIGEKLGSFRLDSVVGSGAMGVVYRGVNEATGKTAAIKVVSGEISQRGKVYDRFMREAEILKQFRHPNIVRFLAVGRFQGTSYIAMEFIQGETLDKVLERRGVIPWREVVDLAIQICEALHYAHEHGVVHRDLKPSNLMLTPDGRLKLTDFGIAKDLDATALTATGRTLGTAAYMAPEQIRGAPAVSHKTDLYALGIVLYQLLVGKPPFEGSSPMILMHNHLNEPPPRPSDKVEEIPVAVDDLVVALMAKDPADRPWDAAAVAHKLSELKQKSVAGKAVKMVWAQDGSAVQNPARLGTVSASRKSPSENGSPAKRDSGRRSKKQADGGGSVLFSRAGLETMGLVLALFALGGLMVYLAWPPNARYLYEHAKPLMESDQRTDWLIAFNEYINPLNQRFPNHPYRAETNAWRDKILLDKAVGQARILRTGLSKAKDKTQDLFVNTETLAAKDSEQHDDLRAEARWRSMADALNPDEDEERGWFLLARSRAEELDRQIKARRVRVEAQLEQVEEAYQRGLRNRAITLQAKLVEEYALYTDLADLFTPMNDPSPTADYPPPDSTAPKPAPNPSQTPGPSPATSDQPAPKSSPSAESPKSDPAAKPPSSDPKP